jgi:hypothetical protein
MSDIVLQAILSVYKKYKLYKDNDNDNDNDNDKWVRFVRPLRGLTNSYCASGDKVIRGRIQIFI